MPRRLLAILLSLFVSLFTVALIGAPTAAEAHPWKSTPSNATPSKEKPWQKRAWTEGPCDPLSQGVTVVADLTKFSGGKVIRRCATDAPKTAFAALESTGLKPAHGTGDGQTGPYQYLCRINGLPATDPCTGFVPNAPYWAFWVPDSANANWAYAQEGVDTYKPVNGVVIGFSFGAGTATDPNQMSLTLAQAKDPRWGSSR